jgi:hypothetical protein
MDQGILSGMDEDGPMHEGLMEEEKKLRLLRFVIDINQAMLMQQADLSLCEAVQIMRDAKRAALSLFPDKEHVYDLIYAPRFRRIIAERFVIPGGLARQR